MRQIRLKKETHSEKVVRKCLYWCSEFCKWELQSTDTYWVIRIDDSDDAAVAQFHRILNDFLLREELDHSTKNLRIDVITAALRRLSSDDQQS